MTSFAEKSRRDKLPWPDDAVIFASAGQVTAEKQIEFALRAFKKIRQANPNVYIKSHPKGTERVPILEFHLSTTANDAACARERVNKAQSYLVELIQEKGGTVEPVNLGS